MGEGDDRREATSAVQSPGTARTGSGPCVPQSIQQVVQSGARLTVVHCPRGSVLTSVSEAPEMRSRSAGRPHNTKVRTANQRRAHQPSARPRRIEARARRIKRPNKARAIPHSAQLPCAAPQAAAARNSAPDSPPLRHSCSSQCDDGSAAPPRLTTPAACSARGSSQRWPTQSSA